MEPAGAVEIIRGSQKDGEYIATLEKLIDDFGINTFGKTSLH